MARHHEVKDLQSGGLCVISYNVLSVKEPSGLLWPADDGKRSGDSILISLFAGKSAAWDLAVELNMLAESYIPISASPGRAAEHPIRHRHFMAFSAGPQIDGCFRRLAWNCAALPMSFLLAVQCYSSVNVFSGTFFEYMNIFVGH